MRIVVLHWAQKSAGIKNVKYAKPPPHELDEARVPVMSYGRHNKALNQRTLQNT